MQKLDLDPELARSLVEIGKRFVEEEDIDIADSARPIAPVGAGRRQLSGLALQELSDLQISAALAMRWRFIARQLGILEAEGEVPLDCHLRIERIDWTPCRCAVLGSSQVTFLPLMKIGRGNIEQSGDAMSSVDFHIRFAQKHQEFALGISMSSDLSTSTAPKLSDTFLTATLVMRSALHGAGRDAAHEKFSGNEVNHQRHQAVMMVAAMLTLYSFTLAPSSRCC